MPHMSNLPWMEMYMLVHAMLLLMICLPVLNSMNKTNPNYKSKTNKWTW